MQRVVNLNEQIVVVDRTPYIVKYRLLRKIYKNHLLRSFQETMATQTSRFISADKIEQNKMLKNGKPMKRNENGLLRC